MNDQHTRLAFEKMWADKRRLYIWKRQTLDAGIVFWNQLKATLQTLNPL